MFVFRCVLILLCALPGPSLAAAPATGDPFPDLPHGGYSVGYRVSYLEDAARSFGPATDLEGRRLSGPFPRPVQVHLWYPAARSSAQGIPYREYVLAAEIDGRDRVAEVLDAYRASPLRRGADPARLDGLLARTVHAVRDAAPAPGRFPLILYAPSINSDPYENAPLFEFLASHGYVIASAPCLGLDEAETSRDVSGAEAQLGDTMFVLSRVWEEPFVDRARVGVLGFSWGGTSALLLALRHAGVEAVASLDGGHGFPDYRPVAESFPWWNPRKLRAAFLHAVPAEEERDLGFAGSTRYADTYQWWLPGLLHRDFAADFIARYRLAAGDPASPHVTSTYQALGRRLKEFYDAYLKGEEAALAALRSGVTPVPGSKWTHRTGLPPPPTPAQFDAIIETLGLDEAVSRFHAVRELDPEAEVFDEERLLRYMVAWGPERSDDLLKLLRMNLEVHPESADSYYWLGQIRLSREEHSAAAEALARALALDPGHERARRLLGHVEKMVAPQER